MKKQKEVLLIDGRNFCYRHAYTRSNLFSKKRPTGAIFGCLAGLIRLHRYFPDAAICFVWDGADSDQSWRNKLASSYKENRRKKKGAIPIQVTYIRQQIPIITKLVDDLGFKSFCVPKVEADDLIGILSTELKTRYDKVTVYSTDKDMYQLIKDNVAVVRDFDKGAGCKEVTDKEIKKKHGVTSKHWLRYRSLLGEGTDNIAKPIPGVGPKKAIKMLQAGVDPSNDEPHPDYVAHWRKIRLCYRLTKIIRKPQDKRLDEKTQKQLHKILEEAKGSLCRSEEGKTKKRYKQFLEFLSDYELTEIMMKRNLLWQIK